MLKKFKSIHDKKASSVHSIHAPRTSVLEPGQQKGSRISKMITVEGSISGKGDLIIEGGLKGEIDLPENRIVISENGSVEAEVNAKNVKICGRMKGNIIAPDRVEITEDAQFEGEIRTRSISVEDGAYMKAVIEVEKEKSVKLSKKSGPQLHNKSGSGAEETEHATS